MQTSNDAWKIFWICYIYIGCTQPSYLHRKTLYNVRPNFEVAVRDYIIQGFILLEYTNISKMQIYSVRVEILTNGFYNR